MTGLTPESRKGQEIGGAIVLWNSPEGLPPGLVNFTLNRQNPITGDPRRDLWVPEGLRARYAAAAARTTQERGPEKLGANADTDDPKVTIGSIREEDKALYIDGGESRYFVLWGLPQA